MLKPYSIDLRERVIAAVEAGASRRETAEHFGLSPSVVVIWAQRWNATGSIRSDARLADCVLGYAPEGHPRLSKPSCIAEPPNRLTGCIAI
jgi:transposase-like protein